jgi:predicted component of type VI protein secretion system
MTCNFGFFRLGISKDLIAPMPLPRLRHAKRLATLVTAEPAATDLYRPLPTSRSRITVIDAALHPPREVTQKDRDTDREIARDAAAEGGDDFASEVASYLKSNLPRNANQGGR